jgi:hypothetical protein
MIKSDRLSMRTVNPKQMDKLAMFQYLIGNGDYSVTGRHNLRIVALEDPNQPQGFIPIPYDFDYTGLVNTHYAVPGESLGIKTVRERYFLGPCRNKAVQEATVKDFSQYKDEIIHLLSEFEYLDEDQRNDMIGYISSYFNEAEDKDFINRKIASTCYSY